MAEREGEMRIIGKKLWLAFVFAISALSLIGFGILEFMIEINMTILILASFGIFIFFFSLGIVMGWSQIPHNRVWIVEKFGKYIGYPIKAGLCIIFPYFGWINLKTEVFLGQQMIELFMNDGLKEGYGKGHVDFKDSSAPVDAMCYFTIHDPAKAVYAITNVFAGIADKMDGAIRSYLGGYNLNDANTLKVQFHLETILNGVIIEKGDDLITPPTSKKFIEEKKGKEKNPQTKISSPHLWEEIWDTWGVSIDSVVVSDIELSQALMKAREREIVAEADAKAAIHESRKVIILAEGEKKALQLTGEGIAEQIKELVDAGVSHEEAVAYLTNRKKWESMKEAGKTVLIDGGGKVGNMAATGAVIAAGAGTVNSS